MLRSWPWLLFLCLAAAGTAAEADKPALPETGLLLPWEGGCTLHIEVVNLRWELTWYDAENQPMPAPVQHGHIRTSRPGWRPQRTVLNPSGDGRLVTVANFRPPHNYSAILTLVRGENDFITLHFSYP